MLITTAKKQMDHHMKMKEGLKAHFNYLLEKILVENSHIDRYWILGKTQIERKGKKEIMRPFLQACLEKPGLVKESFVYEVDSRRGVKQLLWVMHSGDILSFPTLGKSMRVAGSSGVTILSPKYGR